MHELSDLELALRISDDAAVLALAHFREGVTAAAKADGSPVTEADRAVERLLREEFARARPGDSLLGEEYGMVGTSDRVWILDPIDGTSFFARREPHWRIHIALEVGGVLELAIVTSPALGLRWWATRGGGTFEAGWAREDVAVRRLAVSTTASAAAAVDALSEPPGHETAIRFRPPSSPLPLVELIRGEVDGVLAEGFAVWDHAPWILLVREAGGRFTDPTGGGASNRGGGLYSNRALHHELLTATRYPRR